MKNQNEMMRYIWLLNAASNSAYETKELCKEFLRQKQEFQKINADVRDDMAQSAYVKQEIQKNIESLEELQSCIAGVLDTLRLTKAGEGSNAE